MIVSYTFMPLDGSVLTWPLHGRVPPPRSPYFVTQPADAMTILTVLRTQPSMVALQLYSSYVIYVRSLSSFYFIAGLCPQHVQFFQCLYFKLNESG